MVKLIKDITIADTTSPFNNKTVDVFIRQNKIEEIGSIEKENVELIIDGSGKFLSPGWVEVLADFSTSRFIKNELEAAKEGGFTDVILSPNTNPAIMKRTVTDFWGKRPSECPVHLHNLGTITKGSKGKELAEMLTLQRRGAVAFCDGWQPVQDAWVMLKALEYVKSFSGTILQIPIHKTLSADGLINEGETSVRIGLSGIPAIGEAIMINRDLELLRYTNSKLHFSGISTAKSIKLIQSAKEEGLSVTCSVTPYHLLFDDSVLENYNSYYKVNPPLREKADVAALRKALDNGVIDCIASHHRPQLKDDKTQTLAQAAWGMATQETTWPMLNEAMPNIEPEQWAELLSRQPRKIFKLPKLSIKEGSSANLTLFDKQQTSLFNNKSNTVNHPWSGRKMTGKALAL